MGTGLHSAGSPKMNDRKEMRVNSNWGGMRSQWCYAPGFAIVTCQNRQERNKPLPEYVASFLCILPAALFAGTLGKNCSGIKDQKVLHAHTVHTRQ
jgi:hypothetical protein